MRPEWTRHSPGHAPQRVEGRFRTTEPDLNASGLEGERDPQPAPGRHSEARLGVSGRKLQGAIPSVAAIAAAVCLDRSELGCDRDRRSARPRLRLGRGKRRGRHDDCDRCRYTRADPHRDDPMRHRRSRGGKQPLTVLRTCVRATEPSVQTRGYDAHSIEGSWSLRARPPANVRT